MSLSPENKKLRFGIIGTNTISDTILTAGRQDARFEASAVYSRRQETGDAFAEKHDIPHVFTSLEAMLQSGLIDAVYVASPNALHAEQSIAAMQHGLHVLCEKPLASNAREAETMIAEAKKQGVLLMEAMKPTTTPNFAVIKDNLEKVGKPRHYFASYCQYSSRYDRFKAGEAMNAFDLSLSNGAVMDIGTYTIYPMVTLFGEPQSIKATGTLLSTGVDGAGSVTFEYANGMTAAVLYSKITDSTLPSEIQGESGNLLIDRINHIQKVQFVPGRYAKDKTVLELSSPALKDEYFYEIEEFIHLVQSGKTDSEINSHETSLITLRIIDEIRRQTGVVYPADKV